MRAACKRMILSGQLALVAALGCAYQNDTVRASTPARTSVRVGAEPGRQVIVLRAPFVDRRSDQSRCGNKRIGDHETAVVRCAEPPGEWLAQALGRELRANGFRVYDGDALPGEPALRIEGYLEHLFIENQYNARLPQSLPQRNDAAWSVRPLPGVNCAEQPPTK